MNTNFNFNNLYSDNEEKLKQIKIENFVWYIYFGVIALCLLSNKYEKDFILTNNIDSKEKYRKLTILIFTIALLAYLYFAYDNYKSFKNLKNSDSENKKIFTKYSLLGSSLVLISGIIFLWIAIADENLETEIAFN